VIVETGWSALPRLRSIQKASSREVLAVSMGNISRRPYEPRRTVRSAVVSARSPATKFDKPVPVKIKAFRAALRSSGPEASWSSRSQLLATQTLYSRGRTSLSKSGLILVRSKIIPFQRYRRRSTATRIQPTLYQSVNQPFVF
jgi:hypothetical protein